MSEIDILINNYRRIVSLPWGKNLADAEKVWFVVYSPMQERRLRLRVADFQIITQQAGHRWHLVDLTDSFPHWMAGHRYREAYFESPEDLDLALKNFSDKVVKQLSAALEDPAVDENSVIAVQGVASLFGLTRVSTLIEKAAGSIRGRLLLFFPGHYEDGNYRLLDARDGWNYLAVPITIQEGS